MASLQIDVYKQNQEVAGLKARFKEANALCAVLRHEKVTPPPVSFVTYG